ncbi:MAG: hypothetical protein AB7G37_01390 [Solirubrobacteraceae bacterium]
MSFFDDDDFDEPTDAGFDPVSRRASRRTGGLTAPGRPDPHTARVRQMVALGVIVFVLILLTLAVNGCVKSGRTNALKDYSRDVSSLLQTSSDEVGRPLFETLSSGGDANTLRQSLNRLRENAERTASRVEALSPPGDDRGRSTQYSLELALNLRARALRIISAQIADATADQGDQAISQIAGQMQALVASDVIILTRTKPLIDEALKDADVSGLEVNAPRVISDIAWLDPDTVAQNLSGTAGSTSGGSRNQEVTDRSDETPTGTGPHGSTLNAARYGDVTLEGGGADNAVTGRKVSVDVANTGQSDSSRIDVGLIFTPEGGRATPVKKTVPSLAAGQSTTVELTMPRAAKAGVSGQLEIKIGGVPGEENLDNNSGTYAITIGG